MPNAAPFTRLFLISFLTLFAEMCFLRYLPSNIYLLSYYKNSILIAIFLGLGTGFMLAGSKRSYLKYLPLATLVLVAAIVNFNDYLRIDIDHSTMDESIWPEFWANSKAAGVPLLAVLLAFYAAMALYFMPFGQETARAMRFFRPLTAYSINIGGALAGILAFALAGWLWTTPLVWFAVVLVPLVLWPHGGGKRLLPISAASAALTLFILYSALQGFEVWSPYSKVRVYWPGADPAAGFVSTTNGNPQVGSMSLDYSYSGPEKKLYEESRAIYELPYRFMTPGSVAIAGAGAGNEAAVALRAGAHSVSAVEIDPVFVEISNAVSPHRPYLDSRVSVHVDDARAFFQKAESKFDLVVIGFLDAQYHLTHLSNIRTENFVYTAESIARTRELLTDKGMLQLNYNSPRPDMRKKLFHMIRDAYGPDVLVYEPQGAVSGNISFLAGPGVAGKAPFAPGLRRVFFREGTGNLVVPTDDWPFLYLDRKKMPGEYLPMLFAVPVISVVILGSAVRSARSFSFKYFMLGAGFMLLETKSITSFALLFGSTITVVTVVIASILAAILLANLATGAFGIRSLLLPYALVIASLAALYFLPLAPLMKLGWGAKLAVSMTLIAAPLFFAAVVFAVSFSSSTDVPGDLGSNILGAVFGGMFEYLSMALGFGWLYLLSIGAYTAALAADARKGRISWP